MIRRLPLPVSVLCREYATDVNVLVAKQAIQAIGHISLQLSTRANTCVDKLLSLLTMDIDYVTSETLVAMTSEGMIPVVDSYDCVQHV